MADRTGIEWTDATWNPVRGCSRVSEGCRHCYAETVAARFSGEGQPYHGLARRRSDGTPQWTGEVRLVPEHLADPLRWTRPRRVFVNSMSDLFHERLTNEEIAAVFAVMALAARHTFQVLTKRPARMRGWFAWAAEQVHALGGDSAAQPLDANLVHLHGPADDPVYARELRKVEDEAAPLWPLPNVWIGVSVEDQRAADERVPLLLDTPAAVRFLSCEPLLGPVRISEYLPNPLWADLPSWRQPEIEWVIAGGESGHGARPMHPDWARGLRDQCAAVGVPFFFKQWGEWADVTFDEDRPDRAPEGQWLNLAGGQGFHGARVVRVQRMGKRTAGRVLDGRTWDEFPALELGV